MNNTKLNELVNVTENRSKIFDVNQIVHVCKRLKNKKREFLFVNSFQGKHIPTSPTTSFKLFQELAKDIEEKIDKSEKIVVIGFAETATAIGHYISISLENCIYHMQTTREILKDDKPIVEFKEEHCHAPEQLLYGNIEMLALCDRVLFVEDEITTGKTILNFIQKLKVINPKLKYAVASIINWQDKESGETYEKQNIDTYFVIRGNIKDVHAKIDVKTKEKETFNKSCYIPKITVIENNLCNFKSERGGNKPQKEIYKYRKVLYDKISESGIDFTSINENGINKALVIGTEEFMFSPMIYASQLEEKANLEVKFQATTRSPIEVSDTKGYVLNKRYKLTSAYNPDRTTYIYNLEKYDKVVIITDCMPTEEFVTDIISALVSVGNNLEDIEIVVLQ